MNEKMKLQLHATISDDLDLIMDACIHLAGACKTTEAFDTLLMLQSAAMRIRTAHAQLD